MVEEIGIKNGEQPIPEVDFKTESIRLQQENNALREYLSQVQMDNILKRLDYLFRVIENAKSGVFSDEFIADSAKEIEAIVTIKEESITEEPSND